jgi:hypothetical protein
MLRPIVIVQDSAAAMALTTWGLAGLVMVAVVSLALWIVVARGRARREIKDFDTSANDPALRALRQEDLVVQDAPASPAPDDTVVAQLVRAGQPPSGD